MSNCQKNEGNNNNTKEGFDWWKIGGLAAAGFGAAATYFYINSQKEPEATHSQRSSSSSSNNECRVNSHSSTMNSSQIQFEAKGIKNVPENPIINNLNSILSDIYVRYVAIKRDDFRLHYRVFDKIFYCLHQKMKKVDKYYNRYSGMVQFGGSHYDGLRITKPDEFDMHIVIGMPLNINTDRLNHDNSDIIFEPTEAGFIQFKMGSQYTNLLYRDNWDIHQTCYKWKDENNYLLRSKFSDWFKSVVVRALNDFDERLYGLAVFTIDGSQYTIDRSESGPAITLKIKNRFTGFSMDVDLVPSLRFPESRWPITPDYREIPPNCKKDFFMVVPKMDKNSTDAVKKTRSWRLALHYQERELIYDSKNLRTAIKLLKKLRDTLDMSKIASYYIKMLVYGEVVRRNDSSFGTKSIADLFKIFVDVFHRALVAKKIPFLWNEDNNLLDGVSPITLDIYAGKLQKLKRILEVPSDYRQVAKFLLTPYEYRKWKMSSRGGGEGDRNWVPIAAGVVISGGVIALLYKMLFAGCRAKAKGCNQQIGAPYRCTYTIWRPRAASTFSGTRIYNQSGVDWFSDQLWMNKITSAEEQERRLAEEERRRQAQISASNSSNVGQSTDISGSGGRGGGARGRGVGRRPARAGGDPESSGFGWSSVLGSTLLMALFGFLAKTGSDPGGWAQPIHSYFQWTKEFLKETLSAETNDSCEVIIDDNERSRERKD